MDVNIYIPHPALQSFIWNISTINAELPDGLDEVITPYPPTPFQSLMFYCNDAVSMGRDDEHFSRQPLSLVIGPQFSRVNIKVHRRLNAVRVDFLPGGMFRMFGIPMHLLFDEGLDANDVLGPEMTALSEKMSNLSQLEEGKCIIENFLLERLAKTKEILPFDSTMHLLLNNNGDMSIEKAASLACLSLKQFERKCKERIGMNPKMYTRILKFSRAYRLHECFPKMSWTNIAHESGYYDQMHMIRDFKLFAGVNPTAIELELLATPLRMQKDLR